MTPTVKVHPNAGDLVEVQWEPTKLRKAIFVRVNRAGGAVVRMDQLDARREPTGEFSTFTRTIEAWTITRVVRTAEQLAKARAEADAFNAQLQRERDANGGELASERAMRLADEYLTKKGK